MRRLLTPLRCAGNATGAGCGTRAHWGKSLQIYDALPREIRDRLKIARSNVCAGCVRARLKREGLEATLRQLDQARRLERVRHGREVWWQAVEDLRP